MRAAFIIGFKDKTVKERIFPNNYRQAIVAFLKDCIRNGSEELKNKLWGKSETETNYPKPFTFSVYLPNAKPDNKKIKFYSSDFTINFSFGYYNIDKDERLQKEINGFEIFTNFYNGLQKRKYDFILDFSNYGGEKYNIYLKKVFIRQSRIYNNQEKNVFKTLSPIIVRKINMGKNNEWLFPDNNEYNEWFIKSITGLSKKFINTNNINISFNPLSIKRVDLTHHNEHVVGFTGKFSLEAPDEVKKLLYEVGVGAKRNEGFGMIEVV